MIVIGVHSITHSTLLGAIFPYLFMTEGDNPHRYKWYFEVHIWNGEIYGPPNCPTWTDEGGCRCMLAPEEQ